MHYRHLQRDPFARATFIKMIAPMPDTFGAPACRWCGTPRARFHYVWMGDNWTERQTEHELWSGGSFCSVSCWRSLNI